MTWHVMLFNLMLVASCGYALRRGGPPERIVGGSLLLAALATVVAYSPLAGRFEGVETGLFAIDFVLFVLLTAVALRADRGWPFILAGLQLDTVGAHLVKAINLQMIGVTYALMITAWSYPMLVFLAIGTLRHRRRLIRLGYDHPWRVSDEPADASAT